MKRFTFFQSAICALVLLNAALVSKVAADERTLTGTVAVEKNDDGAVKTISIKLDDGSAVSVTVDDNGKKLASELEGKKAAVTGDVVEQNDKKFITVTSYKSTEK